MSENNEELAASFTTLKLSYNLSLLEAAKAQYTADLMKHQSELEMLINHGVGVGDHSQMVKDVMNAIDGIDDAKGRLRIVDQLINIDYND